MRIRALLLQLLPCLLATGATRARTAETASLPPAPTPAPRVPVPYRLRLDVDIGLFLGGLVLWGGTSFVGAGSAPPSWCGTATTPPCDPSGLNALDRAAVGLFDPRAHTAADVITGVVPGALTVFDLLDAGLVDNWRGWLADAVVISEAVGRRRAGHRAARGAAAAPVHVHAGAESDGA